MGLQDRQWYHDALGEKRRRQQASSSSSASLTVEPSSGSILPAVLLMATFLLIGLVWYAFMDSRSPESVPRFAPSSLPASLPAAAGCIQFRQSCKCLDQNGADVLFSNAQCLAIIRSRQE